MKKIIYTCFLFTGLLLSACGDETNELVEQIGDSPNFMKFAKVSEDIAGIADGSEYDKEFPVLIDGPSVENLSGAYTATISVNSSSTAIEGVHYRIENKSVQVDKATNLTSVFKVTMLTDGIVTPLASSPVLVLNVTAVNGAGNVIASGKPMNISLLYLCPSDLEGSYEVTITRDDGNVYVYNDFITETGVGKYRGTSVGHWAPGTIGGTPGFDFTDVCSVITVPGQNLVDLYSNQVFQSGDSYVDPLGNLHIEYTVTFAAGDRTYKADYVKL